MKTELKNPHLGQRFWSDFFKSMITCVGYFDDKNWYFTTDTDLKAGVRKAQTPFSVMEMMRERNAQ